MFPPKFLIWLQICKCLKDGSKYVSIIKEAKSEFSVSNPSIAQLVERRTVVGKITDILRSLVRIRFEGIFCILICTNIALHSTSYFLIFVYIRFMYTCWIILMLSNQPLCRALYQIIIIQKSILVFVRYKAEYTILAF